MHKFLLYGKLKFGYQDVSDTEGRGARDSISGRIKEN
jgi:hypothetical protein